MHNNLIAPCGMNCGLCVMFLRNKNKCPGCISGRKVNGKCINCGIRLCKERRGKYCLYCNTFPCRRLKRLDKRYRERCGMSEIENLIIMKEKGMESFLKKEKEKWINADGIYCVHDRKRYPVKQ